MFKIPWGDPRAFGTAAYWISQYLLVFGRDPVGRITLGGNLVEETVACLLGGHGIKAEVALAAFHTLREASVIERGCSAEAIEATLARGVSVGGRRIKYRFPAQRAGRIAQAVEILTSTPDIPADPRSLRSLLLGIPGVGPKTASWIARNVTDSDDIAVIDTHVYRAGLLSGFFHRAWTLPRDYFVMEDAFLAFSRAGRVSPRGLDLLIWDQMRRRYRVAASMLARDGGLTIPDVFGLSSSDTEIPEDIDAHILAHGSRWARSPSTEDG